MKTKLTEIKLKNKKLKLPAFFPDATYGEVIGVNSKELEKCRIDGLVVNIYHLLKHNLIKKIERKRGIHRYMNFPGIVISDSGGYQAMSLIYNNKRLGKILKDKIIFKLDNKKIVLTPETCIKLQLKIKSDIVMCLDDCTKPELSLKEQKKSVERTIFWAGKCKKEFLRLTKNKKEKPLLFAIIQGGNNKKLRKQCAEKLIEIGFDGYAFGGFPIQDGKLLKDILRYVESLIPKSKIKYAMGIGKPDDIVYCYKCGYNMFDCVIPTRDARHKRLYVFNKKTSLRGNFYKQVNIRASKPETRKLALLFKTNYKKAINLATMRNLTFYSKLMRKLRRQ